MRIATFNIWNSPLKWSQGRIAIVDGINHLSADIILLQEAPIEAEPGVLTVDFLREETEFAHVVHLTEPLEPEDREWPEGLVTPSRFPMSQVKANWEVTGNPANNWAICVVSGVGDTRVNATNVHLDWQSEERRQIETVLILEELIEPANYEIDIIADDFNDDSAVVNFLGGLSDIDGKTTAWRELVAEAYAANSQPAPPIIDPESNPRWEFVKEKEPARRFDRIYLRSNSGESGTVDSVQAGIFGKEPNNRFGIVPSDHYGVYTDIGSSDLVPSLQPSR